MRRGIAIGGMMLAAVIGGAAATAVQRDEHATADPAALVDRACRDAAAVLAAGDAEADRRWRESPDVSAVSGPEAIDDAGAQRLRHAALTAVAAALEQPRHWLVAEHLVRLSVVTDPDVWPAAGAYAFDMSGVGITEAGEMVSLMCGD